MQEEGYAIPTCLLQHTTYLSVYCVASQKYSIFTKTLKDKYSCNSCGNYEVPMYKRWPGQRPGTKGTGYTHYKIKR